MREPKLVRKSGIGYVDGTNQRGGLMYRIHHGDYLFVLASFTWRAFEDYDGVVAEYLTMRTAGNGVLKSIFKAIKLCLGFKVIP